MTNTRDDILNWLNEVMNEPEECGGVSIISLMHSDGNGREVDVYSIKSGSPKWGNADVLSDLFYRLADRHARGLPGAQQFKLQAMFGPENKPARPLPFGMTGMLHWGGVGGGMATEAPTATGQLQQAMRLTEQLNQHAHASQIHTSQMQQQINSDLRAENLTWKRENAELWIALKDTILELLKWRHDTRMAELSAARAAEFQRQLMALAPALMNMFAGKEVFPSMLAEKSVLDGLSAGATPEQMAMFTNAIAAQIPNGQYLSGVVMDHYNKYHERQAREKETQKRLLSSLPGDYESGEKDAVGQAMSALRGPRDGVKPPELGAKVMKALETSPVEKVVASADVNGTNGAHTAEVVEATPASAALAPNEEDDLLDVMLGGATESEVDMLAGMLAMKRPDVPDLAARIKARFAAVAAKRQAQ